jgi:transposase
LATGSQWNTLPERYGKWNSVYRVHYRWSRSGLWGKWFQKVAAKHPPGIPLNMIDATHVKAHQDACRYGGDPVAEGFGKTKGGRNSKINCVVNRAGLPISMVLMPGNRHEITTAQECLKQHRKAIVLGDKGYDSNELRKFIEEGGGFAMIPPKKNRKKPIFYDSEIGKRRHKVENNFCSLKRFRRVDTRYDKRGDTFMGFVFLAAISVWTRK